MRSGGSARSIRPCSLRQRAGGRTPSRSPSARWTRSGSAPGRPAAALGLLAGEGASWRRSCDHGRAVAGMRSAQPPTIRGERERAEVEEPAGQRRLRRPALATPSATSGRGTAAASSSNRSPGRTEVRYESCHVAAAPRRAKGVDVGEVARVCGAGVAAARLCFAGGAAEQGRSSALEPDRVDGHLRLTRGGDRRGERASLETSSPSVSRTRTRAPVVSAASACAASSTAS